MAFFTDDFCAFFIELANNNNREWFQDNKKRYESSVKQPFKTFIAELLHRISQEDPRVQITPKDAILRINRDIRFSKDKTPYNLHRTAFLSAGGRKNKEMPGFFLRLSPEMIGVMAGAYQPNKENLHRIRTKITNQASDLSKIIDNKAFIDKFGYIKGEQNKRIPKEFQAAVRTNPLIANKQFYLMAELAADWITKVDLVDHLMTYYHTARPFNDFLQNAMES
ncbi:MAG: DUF2461 domain-containing protein [Saprospiraceae bacterium]|nr:DUF2461 domain-containing protein [Saprospiraceae bacterium]